MKTVREVIYRLIREFPDLEGHDDWWSSVDFLSNGNICVVCEDGHRGCDPAIYRFCSRDGLVYGHPTFCSRYYYDTLPDYMKINKLTDHPDWKSVCRHFSVTDKPIRIKQPKHHSYTKFYMPTGYKGFENSAYITSRDGSCEFKAEGSMK